MTFTGQLGTAQSRPGNIVLGIMGGPRAIELSADFVLDLVMVAEFGHIRLSADFVLDLALSSAPVQGQALTADFVLDLALAPGISQGQELSADFVLDLALDPGLIQGQNLSADFVLDLVMDEVYIGPGSGVVLGGVTQAQQIALLREGDEFRATLAWAGVRGRTGLARVLSRTIDAQERLTFVLLFIPNTDPSTMLARSDTGQSRYVVSVKVNLARRVRQAERAVGKMESNS